jgi:hypothetical protein
VILTFPAFVLHDDDTTYFKLVEILLALGAIGLSSAEAGWSYVRMARRIRRRLNKYFRNASQKCGHHRTKEVDVLMANTRKGVGITNVAGNKCRLGLPRTFYPMF